MTLYNSNQKTNDSSNIYIAMINAFMKIWAKSFYSGSQHTN